MEQKQPLVSLITYCFNGERFIKTYFEALLAQTYTNLEIFFYNNGSVDATGDIAEAYRPLLEKKFHSVTIKHYEKNQPTAALKTTAFLQLQGKYFLGVDSDDIMSADHVEKMVQYLENNPDTDLVFCQLHTLNEETCKHTGLMQVQPRKTAREHFLDCLFSRNMIYTPIGYMVRTEGFLKANHSMRIFETRYGENYQILLPLLYYKKPGLLQEPLGEYLVRRDSYTGNLSNYEKKITALEAQNITIHNTLKQMQIPDAEKYDRMNKKRIYADCLHLAIDSGDKANIAAHFQRAKKAGAVYPKLYIKYLLSRFRKS